MEDSTDDKGLVSNDLEFLPPSKQQVVLAAEYVFFVEGKPATIGSIAEALNQDIYTIEELLLSKEVIAALESRGINVGASKVKEKQMAFLLCMFNPMESRSHRQIMRDLGISLSEFYGWNRSPEFKRMMNRIADDFFQNAGVLIDRTLVSKAINGNMQAISIYYSRQREDRMSDPKIFIQNIVEVIQKEVPDQDAQKRIAQKLIQTGGFNNAIGGDTVKGELG